MTSATSKKLASLLCIAFALSTVSGCDKKAADRPGPAGPKESKGDQSPKKTNTASPADEKDEVDEISGDAPEKAEDAEPIEAADEPEGKPADDEAADDKGGGTD